MVPDTLTTYRRLHVDLSWAVYDELSDREGHPDAAWVELVGDFPDPS